MFSRPSGEGGGQMKPAEEKKKMGGFGPEGNQYSPKSPRGKQKGRHKNPRLQKRVLYTGEE